jgi:hypothetical protein
MGEINRSHTHDLIAPSYAFPAENALIGIKIKGGIGSIRGFCQFGPAEALNRPLLNPYISGHFQKLTGQTLMANQAFIRMVRDGHLHDLIWVDLSHKVVPEFLGHLRHTLFE